MSFVLRSERDSNVDEREVIGDGMYPDSAALL